MGSKRIDRRTDGALSWDKSRAKGFCRMLALVALALFTAVPLMAGAPSKSVGRQLITLRGVENGRWYNHPVRIKVRVDKHAVARDVVKLSLNGRPYVPGTAVRKDGYYMIAYQAVTRSGKRLSGGCTFAIDTKAPVIRVTNLVNGAVVKDNPFKLDVSIQDNSQAELTVNGRVAQNVYSGGQIVVPLKEGRNKLRIKAEDKAGNVSWLRWHVTLKTSGPKLTIMKPKDGAIMRLNSIEVGGTVSKDAVSVELRSKTCRRKQETKGGRFLFNGVPTKEGKTVFSLTAEDAAGNVAKMSFAVTRDTRRPQILIFAPPGGIWTTKATYPLQGVLLDITKCRAEVNGVRLAVSAGGRFSANVPLHDGRNWLDVTATDAAGNAARRSVLATKVKGPAAVAKVVPAPGAKGVSPSTGIEVRFDRPVNPTTVTPGSFKVSCGGKSVAGAVFARRKTAWFLPARPLCPCGKVTVSLDTTVRDAAGVAIRPYTETFTVWKKGLPGADLGRITFVAPAKRRPGRIRAVGDPGATNGGAPIRLLNASHPEWEAGQGRARKDGSFEVGVRGYPMDRLELLLPGRPRPADGQMVIPAVFRSGNTSTSLVGSAGGIVAFKGRDKRLLAKLWVPPGAFPTPLPVGFKAVDLQKVPALPEGVTVLSAFKLQMRFSAKVPLTLLLPRPEGIPKGARLWLVRKAPWGPGGKPAPSVAEILSPCGRLGDAARPFVATSGTLPGFERGGVFFVCAVKGKWAFLEGSAVPSDSNGPGFGVRSKATPFVGGAGGEAWCLPVPVQKTQQVFKVDVKKFFEPPIYRLSWERTLVDGEIADAGTITDEQSLPFPQAASAPFVVEPIHFSKPRFKVGGADRLRFQLVLDPKPDLIVSAFLRIPPGPTASNGAHGEAPHPKLSLTIKPPSGRSHTGYFSLGRSGASLGISLSDFKRADGSPAGLRSHLDGRSRFIITYPDGKKQKTVEFMLPSTLPMALRHGHLAFVISPESARPGTLVRLYDAAIGRKNPLLTSITAGADGVSIDLSSLPVSDKSHLSAWYCTHPVAPAAVFTFAFRGEILSPADTGGRAVGRARLSIVGSVQGKNPPPGRRRVPLKSTFMAGGRWLKAVPESPLKPGCTYDLALTGLAGKSGIRFPANAAPSVRFRVSRRRGLRLAKVTAGAPHLRSYGPIAASGVVVAVVNGQDGLDVFDVSDPGAPVRIAQEGSNRVQEGAGPVPIALPGPAAAVAVASTLPEGKGRRGAAVVVAGIEPGGKKGYVALYPLKQALGGGKADGKGLEVGSPVLSYFPLAQATNASTGHLLIYRKPVEAKKGGSPVPAQAFAFFSATGEGLVVVPLALSDGSEAAPPVEIGTFRSPRGGAHLTEAINVAGGGGLGLLPPEGEDGKPYLIEADGRRLLAWDISDPYHPRAAGRSPLPPGGPGFRPGRIRVAAGYSDRPRDPSAIQRPSERDLILVGGKQEGLLVYEAYPWNPSHLLEFRGAIPVSDAGRSLLVEDFGLDRGLRRAYVEAGTGALFVIDLTRPFRHPSDKGYPGWGPLYPFYVHHSLAGMRDIKEWGGKVDRDGDGVDDRIIDRLPLGADLGTSTRITGLARTGFNVLAEAVAGGSSSLVLEAVGKPGLAFWIKKSSGHWGPPPGGHLSAFRGDKVRLALHEPGGAGREIKAALQLLDRKGQPEEPSKDSTGKFIPGTAHRLITLVRQSDDKADPNYNLYLQREDEAVQLGMRYDEKNPFASALMITRRGGTLKASIKPPDLGGPCQQWNGHLTISTLVSRPWVQWGGDQLLQPDDGEGDVEVVP